MKLPNSDRIVVDILKLADYCLSPWHPRGRHKARVFQSALGIDQKDAEFLKTLLLRAAREGEAHETNKDEFGQRYVIDAEISGPSGQAIVRSTWIILSGDDIPRFVSCYVK